MGLIFFSEVEFWYMRTQWLSFNHVIKEPLFFWEAPVECTIFQWHATTPCCAACKEQHFKNSYSIPPNLALGHGWTNRAVSVKKKANQWRRIKRKININYLKMLRWGGGKNSVETRIHTVLPKLKEDSLSFYGLNTE